MSSNEMNVRTMKFYHVYIFCQEKKMKAVSFPQLCGASRKRRFARLAKHPRAYAIVISTGNVMPSWMATGV
jgi:hypothetical protein